MPTFQNVLVRVLKSCFSLGGENENAEYQRRLFQQPIIPRRVFDSSSMPEIRVIQTTPAFSAVHAADSAIKASEVFAALLVTLAPGRALTLEALLTHGGHPLRGVM
jgi:hypothetical protein